MTPDQYEKFWGNFKITIYNLTITLSLTAILTLIATIIAVKIYPDPLWFNPQLLAIPSFIISLLSVFFVSSVKQFDLLSHPIIYWWVILFGHKEPVNGLFKFSGRLSTIRSIWDQEHYERAHTILSQHNLGLYYLPRNSERPDYVYFVNRQAVMALKLSKPEGGFKFD